MRGLHAKRACPRVFQIVFFISILGPITKQLTPDCYDNLTHFEENGDRCRLGNEPGKPFSSVSIVDDFCAHAHKDHRNFSFGMYSTLLCVSNCYFWKGVY